jgi:ribosomal protein S18 acetylase RimI-like enzyme
MFVDVDLAVRAEQEEAKFMDACSRATGLRYDVPAFQVPIAGGVATYAGPESPFNKVVGVGFAGAPTAAELNALEERYAEHDAPTSFEIATLAAPEVFEALTERGYRLVSFENVLLRRLEATNDEPSIVRIDVRRAEGELEVWLNLAIESALHPDTAGVPQHATFPRESLEAAEMAGADAGARLYVATIEGEPAGAGGFRVAGEFAQLTGAGTVPAFRRRGVQKELVRTRMRDAHEAGCEYAIVTTQPGSISQANMQKFGFGLGYARAVLARAT